MNISNELVLGGCLVVNTHGTEESEAVGGSQLFEVDLEEYTGIVEGFWIKTDFTGREHIIRIDNQKYFSKDKADFRKLTIDSVENSDAGYYVYRATDDLETVDSSPIIFLVKGLYVLGRDKMVIKGNQVITVIGKEIIFLVVKT